MTELAPEQIKDLHVTIVKYKNFRRRLNAFIIRFLPRLPHLGGGGSYLGFTLAEILITLSIIGVVAALTISSLIQINKNREVEVKLLRFYSSVNNAIKIAEIDYGDKEDWVLNFSKPADITNWFDYYLKPHMNVVKTSTYNSGALVNFADGTNLYINGTDWYFYTIDKQKCEKSNSTPSGRCLFMFNYLPISNDKNWEYLNHKGVEPYKFSWDGKLESLNSGIFSCKGNNPAYCTNLIQMNGWKIPAGYPWKVR